MYYCSACRSYQNEKRRKTEINKISRRFLIWSSNYRRWIMNECFVSVAPVPYSFGDSHSWNKRITRYLTERMLQSNPYPQLDGLHCHVELNSFGSLSQEYREWRKWRPNQVYLGRLSHNYTIGDQFRRSRGLCLDDAFCCKICNSFMCANSMQSNVLRLLSSNKQEREQCPMACSSFSWPRNTHTKIFVDAKCMAQRANRTATETHICCSQQTLGLQFCSSRPISLLCKIYTYAARQYCCVCANEEMKLRVLYLCTQFAAAVIRHRPAHTHAKPSNEGQRCRFFLQIGNIISGTPALWEI